MEFAAALASHGVELVSTGGTAKALRDAGLAVRDISDLTGFPEMLDGRVKTLHPNVHGGILHIRDNPAHVDSVNQHAIQPIDMVVVNLYAFEKTAQKVNVSAAEMIENIDIGGPSMVRSAAKNFEDVAVVTSVADYARLTAELAENNGLLSRATRWQLARQAFATTAAYDAAIASTLETLVFAEDSQEPAVFDSESLPSTLRVIEPRTAILRYGENPHQQPLSTPTGRAVELPARSSFRARNSPITTWSIWMRAGSWSPSSRTGGGHHQAHQSLRRRDRASILDAYTRALAADPVSASAA